MTYEEIFQTAKEAFLKRDVSGLQNHMAVQIDITGEGAGAFYVELKDGALVVEPYEYYDRDLKLIVSAKNLLKLMDGSLDAGKAFALGKLKIEGDLGKALELQKIISSTQDAL
jgi:putative sterol carrier protein